MSLNGALVGSVARSRRLTLVIVLTVCLDSSLFAESNFFFLSFRNLVTKKIQVIELITRKDVRNSFSQKHRSRLIVANYRFNRTRSIKWYIVNDELLFRISSHWSSEVNARPCDSCSRLSCVPRTRSRNRDPCQFWNSDKRVCRRWQIISTSETA